MTDYALRLANGQDTAPRMRMGDALGLVPNGALGARNGLRPGGGEVTVVAGGMTVQVTPFLGWVDGGASDAQGGYPFVLDATKTLTIADGDASLARVDTIVARVQDDGYDGQGVTAAAVEVVQGTPGGGAPALPVSCIPLRDVNVPAGVSAGTGGLSASNLGADRRTYTTGLGGVLQVSGTTERDALGATDGQPVYRQDTDTLEVLLGGQWATVQAMAGAAPYAYRYLGAVVNVGSTVTLDFDTAASGGVGITYSAGTFTVPKAGLYMVTVVVNYSSATTGYTATSVFKNGSTRVGVARIGPNGYSVASLTRPVRMAAGDTIRVDAFYSAGTLQARAGEDESYCAIAYVGP